MKIKLITVYLLMISIVLGSSCVNTNSVNSPNEIDGEIRTVKLYNCANPWERVWEREFMIRVEAGSNARLSLLHKVSSIVVDGVAMRYYGGELISATAIIKVILPEAPPDVVEIVKDAVLYEIEKEGIRRAVIGFSKNKNGICYVNCLVNNPQDNVTLANQRIPHMPVEDPVNEERFRWISEFMVRFEAASNARLSFLKGEPSISINGVSIIYDYTSEAIANHVDIEAIASNVSSDIVKEVKEAVLYIIKKEGIRTAKIGFKQGERESDYVVEERVWALPPPDARGVTQKAPIKTGRE